MYQTTKLTCKILTWPMSITSQHRKPITRLGKEQTLEPIILLTRRPETSSGGILQTSHPRIKCITENHPSMRAATMDQWRQWHQATMRSHQSNQVRTDSSTISSSSVWAPMCQPEGMMATLRPITHLQPKLITSCSIQTWGSRAQSCLGTEIARLTTSRGKA